MLEKELINEFNLFITSYEKLKEQQHKIGELNVAEIHTVVIIGKSGKLNVSELAKLRSISRSAVTQLTDKLKEKGLIEKVKNKNNRKELMLSLSTKGEVVYREHRSQQKYLEDKIYTVINKYSKKELEILINMLSEIRDIWNTLPWIKEDAL